MARKATSQTKKDAQTQIAYTAVDFFYQLQHGGEFGWDDRLPFPEGEGQERFIIRYYDAPIAAAELVDTEYGKKAKITVYGTPKESPLTLERKIAKKEWTKLHNDVIEALKNLSLPFNEKQA